MMSQKNKKNSTSICDTSQFKALSNLINSATEKNQTFFNSISFISSYAMRSKSTSKKETSFSNHNSCYSTNNKLQRTTLKRSQMPKLSSSSPSSLPTAVKQLKQQTKKILKKMFQHKCQILSIPFNEQKFQVFINGFIKKNYTNQSIQSSSSSFTASAGALSTLATNLSSDSHSKKQVDISEMNLKPGCEKLINDLVKSLTHDNKKSSRITGLKLYKNLIHPNRLNLQSIQYIYVGNNNLGNRQLEMLFSSLIKYNRIRCLDLNSPQIVDKNYLTSYQKLYELIAKCNKLEILMLCSIGLKPQSCQIFKHLKGSAVRVLDVSHNQGIVGTSPDLTYLNLSHNNIVNPDALYSLECKVKNQVQVLNISHNPIPSYQLQKFLKHSYFCNIQELNMNGLEVAIQCVCLQQFISNSRQIKILSLSKCGLSEISWMNVIIGLKSNQGIIEVDLSKNNISSLKVATELGNAIFSCSSSQIRKLKLNRCDISDDQGKQMMRGLDKNKSLEWIDLSENKLGANSGLMLLIGLKYNISLKHLNVQDNCISYSVQKQLNEYIDRNRFMENQYIKKDYQRLKKCPKLYSDMMKELKKLEQSLDTTRKQRMQLEEKVYTLHSKKLQQELISLKALIKDYNELENNLAAQIDLLEESIYQQPPSQLEQSLDIQKIPQIQKIMQSESNNNLLLQSSSQNPQKIMQQSSTN